MYVTSCNAIVPHLTVQPYGSILTLPLTNITTPSSNMILSMHCHSTQGLLVSPDGSMVCLVPGYCSEGEEDQQGTRGG